MSKRYQKTERVGVTRVALIVEDEFDWIFREQPIVDVGIDALVEKCDAGEPTGKFLALQIKSGEGNVYKSKTSNVYVYYISDVHYYYWVNLNMPILLICYIPNKKKSYWIEVNKINCTKTTKGWKIYIPIINIFNASSFSRINRVVVGGKGNINSIRDVPNKTMYNLGHLDLVNDSLNMLVFITSTYNQRINEITDSLKQLLPEADSLTKASQLEVHKYSLATAFETLASRLYNEIDIFSKTYARWIISARINYMLLLNQNGKEFVMNEIQSISGMVEAYSQAIIGMNAMKLPIQNLKGDNALKEIQTLEKAEIAISTVVLNLSQAQNLGRSLIDDVQTTIDK